MTELIKIQAALDDLMIELQSAAEDDDKARDWHHRLRAMAVEVEVAVEYEQCAS